MLLTYALLFNKFIHMNNILNGSDSNSIQILIVFVCIFFIVLSIILIYFFEKYRKEIIKIERRLT